MWDVLSVEDRSRFPADQRDVLERMDVIDAAIEAAGGLLTLNRR
jgi:hypothetical protein